MTRELGEGDESCRCRRYSDRGAASRGERPGCERDRSPARVWGTSGQVSARPCRRHGEPDGAAVHPDRVVPTFDAGSGERCSLPRPHHAAGMRPVPVGPPFGERRSILCGRSRAWDGPSRFLWRETLAKPETEPSITDEGRRWQRKKPSTLRSLPDVRQRWASD